MNLFRKLQQQSAERAKPSRAEAAPNALTVERDGMHWSPASELQRTASRPRTKSEAVLLGEMDDRLYMEDYDPVMGCLQALPAVCSDKVIEEELAKHDRLRKIISSKLSQQVLDNYTSFVNAMEHIQEIEMDLTLTIVLVSSTRRVLADAKRDFVEHLLETVRQQRRSDRIKELLDGIGRIRNLIEQEQHFRFSLTEFRFADAFESLERCRELRRGLEGVTSLETLFCRLDSSTDFVQAHLDQAVDLLSDHQFGSDPVTDLEHRQLLERVATAFDMLGDTVALGDRLLRAFMSHLDRSLVLALGGSPFSTDGHEGDNYFRELCSNIGEEEFISKFYLALSSCSQMLYSYFKTRQLFDTLVSTKVLPESLSVCVTNLSHARAALWRSVQHRLAQLLLNTSDTVAQAKLTDVLRLLNASHQLMHIGERFGGTDSDVLRPALYERCRAFFHSFHAQSVERLVLTLQSEMWQRLPLPKHYGVLDIKEFRNEKELFEHQERDAELDPDKLFAMFAEGLDLFVFDEATMAIQSPVNVLAPSGTCEVEPERAESVLAASTMVLVRFLGQYIGVMRSLRPIADLAIDASAELFDVYLYAVFSQFVTNAGKFFKPSLSPSMQKLYPSLHAAVNLILQRLKNGSFCNGKIQLTPAPWNPSDDDALLAPSFVHRHNELKLEEAGTLYGLAPRFVALESLKFILNTIKWMDGIVPKYASDTKRIRMLELATYADEVNQELEVAVYRSLAPRLIDWRPILAFGSIAGLNWELKELSTNHHTYIDKMLHVATVFSRRLTMLTNESYISEEVQQRIWHEALSASVQSLVNGFASVKRCSTEGRAAMSLDFNVLLKGLSALCSIWPIPKASFVETYISAFYLPADDLVEWVSDHPEYSLGHVLNIAAAGPAVGMGKNTRQAFMQKISKAHEMARVQTLRK